MKFAVFIAALIRKIAVDLFIRRIAVDIFIRGIAIDLFVIAAFIQNTADVFIADAVVFDICQIRVIVIFLIAFGHSCLYNNIHFFF